MADPLVVEIVRVADGVPIKANVLPISADHLAQVRVWRQDLSRLQEPDQTWDWDAFLAEARTTEQAGAGRFEPWALVADDEVQSLMLLETQAHRSRKDGSALIYVEYLAAAPHNRPAAAARRYRRCGEAMLAVAFHRSQMLGFDGRVGLHSLPTAIPFYLRMGFEDLGEDPEENGLRYFELGPNVVESE